MIDKTPIITLDAVPDERVYREVARALQANETATWGIRLTSAGHIQRTLTVTPHGPGSEIVTLSMRRLTEVSGRDLSTLVVVQRGINMMTFWYQFGIMQARLEALLTPLGL